MKYQNAIGRDLKYSKQRSRKLNDLLANYSIIPKKSRTFLLITLSQIIRI